MKEMKRVLCMLLSVLMLLGLVACGQTPQGTQSNEASSAPASAGDGPETPQATGEKTYDEHLTLSWLMAGIKSGGDYTAQAITLVHAFIHRFAQDSAQPTQEETTL